MEGVIEKKKERKTEKSSRMRERGERRKDVADGIVGDTDMYGA